MKRTNNLYRNNITFTNLYKIYLEIKGNCRSERKLFLFSKDLNTNLIDIENKLLSSSYEFSNFYVFLIKEPKYRVIMSECISDKIVNHFVARHILLPSMEKSFIDSNVATRKNKGSSYGYKLFNKYINKIGLNKNIYVLKIDISKYFYSINHDILKEKISNTIKDKEALELLFKIIDLTDESYINNRVNYLKDKEIEHVKIILNNNSLDKKIKEISNIPLYKKGYGINIGSLVSQTLAIFYLNDLDHYIKEELRCKYYIRYMDDIICISEDKEYLKKCLIKISEELNKLDLKVNSKSKIWSLNKGVNFLGFTYRINNNKLIIKPRNDTYRKIVKKLNYLRKNDYNKYFLSKISYKGYFGKDYIDYKEEYNYLENIYYNYIIFYYDSGKYYYKGYSIDSNLFNKIKKIYTKNNISYIILRENKVSFYN